MKTRLHIWALLPLLAVLACTVEKESVQNEKTVGFKAYLDDSGVTTRTSLGEKDANGFYPVYWSANDKIKVMAIDGKPGEGREFTLTSGAGTAEGVFNGTLSQSDEENVYVAVYPYSTTVSMVNDEWSQISLTIPQEQRYVPDTFDINANPAFAVTSNDELHFKNVCGLVQLKLTGNVHVKRIKLHVLNASEPLWGSVQIRDLQTVLDGGDIHSWALWLSFSGGANESREPHLDPYSLYLNCPEAVQLSDEPTSFYFVVPPGSMSHGFQVELYDEVGRMVGTQNTTEDNTAGRSKVREMPVLDFQASDYLTYADPTAINLSANGTANSYIVHPQHDLYPNGRLYTFYALRKGNGEYPIEGAKSARVLFRTYNNRPYEWDEPEYYEKQDPVFPGPRAVPDDAVITDVVFDEVTGYISFRNSPWKYRTVQCLDEHRVPIKNEQNEVITRVVTIPQEGNATIALLDANHRILWSWHIWVTDYDPETSNETYANGTGAVMMTRNLGALSSHGGNEAFGLYYQWGRKDPFTNDNYSRTDYKTNPEGIFDSGFLETTVPAEDVLEYAVQHPTTKVDRQYQWWIQPTDSPWGRDKTVHDPCPPGWRVPDPEAFFFSGLFNPRTGLFNEVSRDEDPNPDYNRTLGSAQTNYYFPDGQGYGACIVPNVLGAYSLMEGGMYYQYVTGQPRMIRCQREGTGSVQITDLSAQGTANCYVVNRPGTYKFRADVKGNSTESVGGAVKAAITWQSTPTFSAWPWNDGDIMQRKSINSELYGAGVYYKDGYVYFSTEFQWIQGSAVVSVLDDRDRILWSWHIWFTDYDPYASDACITIPGDDSSEPGRQVMKYNLGAVMDELGQASAESRGMMYQWGRKDPYIGAKNASGNVPGIGGEYLLYNTSESLGTVDYTIQNPCVILIGDETVTPPVRDWNNAHDNTLWGPEKTKYDPCPPGYKVPSRDSGYLTVVPGNHGFSYDGNFVPAGGYREHMSGLLANVGDVASYWSSTAADDGSAYDFYWEDGSVFFNVFNHMSPKAQVNHVRCVRE